MQVDSPGSDVLIDHFQAISNFIRQKQSEALQNIEYLSGNRSRQQRYIRSISDELDHLFYAAHSWSDTGLVDAYTSGWRGVYGNAPFTITEAGFSRVEEIRNQYRIALNDIEQHVRNDSRRFMKDVQKNTADELAKKSKGNVDQNMGIKAVTQDVNTKWGTATRQYRLGDYGPMQTKNATQRSFNAGTLDAAEAQGIEVVLVDDGTGCGWTSHHDPDKARGKLVSIDEARSNPIAHPNCVRSFVPQPDKKKKDIDKNSRSKAAGAAELAGLALAAGIGAKVLFQVTTEVVDPEAVIANSQILRAGNIYQRAFNRLVDTLHPLGNAREDADIIPLPFYAEPPPGPLELPLAAASGEGTIPSLSEALQAQYAGPPNLGAWKNSVQDWGEALLDKRIGVPDMPDWVKKSISATNSDPVDLVENKFILFSKWVHSTRVKEESVDQFANVLNFQLKRKQWNEFTILRNWDKLESSVSATWTKYGPRTRIDLTDFFRGKITFTKAGIRRSITFNPRGNYRALLALSQDGTLMGALRYVPNSIFRAIVETDEFGKITGNLRLVPDSLPFRVKMTFGTPRPKNWQYIGLVPGQDFVDLRTAATAARGFSLQDFSFREVYGQLSQMELKDITFEVDLLKQTPFNISQEIKIPISQVRESLQTLMSTGFIRKDGEGFTGIFSWRPSFAAVEELQKLVTSSSAKIMGSISFSSLNTAFSSILPDLKTTAYFADAKFQEVLTSIRISGLSAIKNAKDSEIFSEILGLPESMWNDFRQSLSEVDARIVTFLRNNYHPGIRVGNLQIVEPGPLWKNNVYWSGKKGELVQGGTPNWKWLEPDNTLNVLEGRIAKLKADLNIVGEGGEVVKGVNDADIIKGTMDAITALVDKSTLELFQEVTENPDEGVKILTERTQSLLQRQQKAREAKRIIPGGQTHKKWLRILADINPIDSQSVIERKLQDYVWLLRSANLDSPAVSDTLEQISANDLSIVAGQITNNQLFQMAAENLDLDATTLPISPQTWVKVGGSLKDLQVRSVQYYMDLLERIRDLGYEPSELVEKVLTGIIDGLQSSIDFVTKQAARGGFTFSGVVGNRPLVDNDGILARIASEDADKVKLIKTTIDIDKTAYPELYSDVQKTAAVYERVFPNMEPLKVRITTVEEWQNIVGNITSFAAWSPVKIDGEYQLLINPVVANKWSSPRFRTQLEYLIRRGHFAESSQDPISIIAHEFGHHVTVPLDSLGGVELQSHLDLAILQNIQENLSDSGFSSLTQFEREIGGAHRPYVIASWIKKNISGYAATNWAEAYAEMFADSVMRKSTPEVQRKLVQMVIDSWNDYDVLNKMHNVIALGPETT